MNLLEFVIGAKIGEKLKIFIDQEEIKKRISKERRDMPDWRYYKLRTCGKVCCIPFARPAVVHFQYLNAKQFKLIKENAERGSGSRTGLRWRRYIHSRHATSFHSVSLIRILVSAPLLVFIITFHFFLVRSSLSISTFFFFFVRSLPLPLPQRMLISLIHRVIKMLLISLTSYYRAQIALHGSNENGNAPTILP